MIRQPTPPAEPRTAALNHCDCCNTPIRDDESRCFLCTRSRDEAEAADLRVPQEAGRLAPAAPGLDVAALARALPAALDVAALAEAMANGFEEWDRRYPKEGFAMPDGPAFREWVAAEYARLTAASAEAAGLRGEEQR